MKRREFLENSLCMVAASALLPSIAWGVSSPKRILVLGGTSFLGPAVVEALVAEGHTVTLFNRDVTNPELFPHLEKLRGFAAPIRMIKISPRFHTGALMPSLTYGQVIPMSCNRSYMSTGSKQIPP